MSVGTSMLVLGALLLLLAPGASAGVWVDGETTSDNPRDLTIDRTAGPWNVLHWKAPSATDGRTLTGYWVYRDPGTSTFDPATDSYFIPISSGTAFTDTAWPYSQAALYYVTAVFQDPVSGVVTQSWPSVPAPSYSLPAGHIAWPCQPLDYDAAASVPTATADPVCLLRYWKALHVPP